MRNTFAQGIYDISQEISDIYVVAADISPVGSIEHFRNEFPDQFINVGVAEQAMIGLCSGLALRGCRPFAYTIATFTAYRPFEHIRVEVCYQNLPVTIVGMGAGVTYGTLGGTHHAQEDIGIMGSLPNMTILAPCDPAETIEATWASARNNGPTYLRLGKVGEPDFTSQAPDPFEFGKLRTLKEGKDVCILSYGPIMRRVFDVVEKLEAQGCSVAVESVHTIKPLDNQGIQDVLGQYENVVVIEEHSVLNGLGMMVKQIAWDTQASCQLLTFGLKDEFIHIFGSQEDMWDVHGLGIDHMYNTVLHKLPK
jgi:transketolase